MFHTDRNVHKRALGLRQVNHAKMMKMCLFLRSHHLHSNDLRPLMAPPILSVLKGESAHGVAVGQWQFFHDRRASL